MNFSNKCPSLRILCILEDAKIPVTYDIIRKHISLKYSNKQLQLALDRLVRKGYISRSGKRKNNLYLISGPGLYYFSKIDNKHTAINASNYIFNYLIKIGTGVD